MKCLVIYIKQVIFNAVYAIFQVPLLVAPSRTRLIPYLRLGLGDLFVQILSFLSRLVAVRDHVLAGEFRLVMV